MQPHSSWEIYGYGPDSRIASCLGMQGTQFVCREIFACGIKNHGLWIQDCLRFPCVGRRKTLDRHVVPLAVKTVREESVNSNTDILFPLKKFNKNREFLKIIECVCRSFLWLADQISRLGVFIYTYWHCPRSAKFPRTFPGVKACWGVFI